MSIMYYGWDGKPISREEWVASFGRPRHVDETDLGPMGRVSTVWLGLDHSFGYGPKPLIFETMVFGGPLDLEQQRYSTLKEAYTGHRFMVTWLTSVLDQPKRKQLIHKGGKP